MLALDNNIDCCIMAATTKHKEWLTTTMNAFIIDRINDNHLGYRAEGFEDRIRETIPPFLQEYHDNHYKEFRQAKMPAMFGTPKKAIKTGIVDDPKEKTQPSSSPPAIDKTKAAMDSGVPAPSPAEGKDAIDEMKAAVASLVIDPLQQWS